MTWTVRDLAGTSVPFASLSVTRSLEQLAGTARWTTHSPRRDLLGGEVEILDGDVLRFSGYVEQIGGNARDGYEVAARSRTSNLLRWDADGSEVFRDLAVAAALRSIARPADVRVSFGAPSDRVSRLRLKKSEPIARGVQRLAETYRFIATDNAAGELVAYRAADAPQPVATWRDAAGDVTGSIGIQLDVSDWRNQWLCRGQREAVAEGDDDVQYGIDVSTLAARPSRRILPSRSATSRAHARQFVTWQAQAALARVEVLTVPLARWAAEPGDAVRIAVPTEALDETFVVQAMSATVSVGQVSVTATCVLPEVYAPAPRPPRNIEKRAITREEKLAAEGTAGRTS